MRLPFALNRIRNYLEYNDIFEFGDDTPQYVTLIQFIVLSGFLAWIVYFFTTRIWEAFFHVDDKYPSNDYSRSFEEPRRLDYEHIELLHPFGLAEMQGKRSYMEDRHSVSAKLQGNSNSSFYGVYDGHGGAKASTFASVHICNNIVKDRAFPDDPKQALVSGFLDTDEQILTKPWNDGTTAVTALIIGDKITVANAGDSRAILVKKSGDVHALSYDHKPDRDDEKERIESLGGMVTWWGVWRVQGILAVSRALGDKHLKNYVSATPEIEEWTCSDDDLYLILATDGVWDTVSNDDAGQLALKAGDAQDAAQNIMDVASAKGSEDNICVMVVDLQR